MMIRYLLILLPLLTQATQIEIDRVMKKPLGHIVQTNAQITQLSNQKQEIVSRLPGHIEHYYVKAGQSVKSGDKVVLIESIALSKLSSDFIALKQQIIPAKAQVTTTKKLYKKGLASKNTLNAHLQNLETLRSQKNALSSQLEALGVDASKLKKATKEFILYAHADGVVGKILVSLHANVDTQTSIMTLVNQNGYYATAFLSVKDAMKLDANTIGFITLGELTYTCHFVQLLPSIDQETQRAKVRFSIENAPSNLLLGAFVQMRIALPPMKEMLTVKKSALTLYQGEWVIFTPKAHNENNAHEGHDAHENHDEHKEDAHDEHDAHEGHAHETKEQHSTHDAHENLDEHKEDTHEDETPYDANVVEVIAYSGDEVAIKGLHEEDAYVSKGVYFVKSMLLKSSLGEHGH